MKLCVWDCETTGLPDFKLPADHPQQPYICEIAAVIVDDETGAEIRSFETLIRPQGWEISDELVAIHGITTEMCRDSGDLIVEALTALHEMMREADVTLSYGFRFDDKMRRGECRRHGMEDLFGTFAWACIQPPATAACQMPATAAMQRAGRARQFKTPKLGEAVKILLGEEHEGAHRALADVRAAVRIMFAARTAGYGILIKHPDGTPETKMRPVDAAASASTLALTGDHPAARSIRGSSAEMDTADRVVAADGRVLKDRYGSVPLTPLDDSII